MEPKVDELLDRVHDFVSTTDHTRLDQFAFRGAQFDAGLAWVHFPEGKGGLGLTRDRQAVVDAGLRNVNVPYRDFRINPIGIGMGAPTILAYGTEEMHAKHLRRIFTGEDIWCQMFSEPSHGSDVAGIASRAVRDGDEWVVNGQKVWTTLAHESRFGMLLVRTNPDVPKHAGLSYFVLDMHSPGVDVRPLFQLTGEAEFNEVFLTDVRVPHSAMLGQEGDGWKVATATLMNERVALGGSRFERGHGPIRDLLDTWAKCRVDGSQKAVFRDRVASLWIRAETLRLTNQRATALARSGKAGPEGSLGKLMSAELNQQILELAVQLRAANGMLLEREYPMTRSDNMPRDRSIAGMFLRSRANTIEGGTSETLRNIIGERVLGLPPEIRADKHVPWTEIPTSAGRS